MTFVWFVFEVGVVLVEAWAIMKLAPHRFYKKSVEPLLWKQALLISVCGNIASLVVGFGWLSA